MTRALVIGLDCLGAEVLDGVGADGSPLMPRLAEFAAAGRCGVLESTLPPITVPAWTAMLTGRDPGELGVYGFRNRRSYRYGDLVRASSQTVRYPRLWDRMTAAGRPSVVVGVPQTSPPPAIDGALVCGFEGPLDEEGTYTSPPELAKEIQDVVGDYIFDVADYRGAPLDGALRTARDMMHRRFALMRHLMTTRPWDFAMLHEIGTDRMHHCFWSAHDPAHARHDPRGPYRHAITDYYREVDAEVGSLLALLDPGDGVLIASDHGATAMQGGVCVNEVLLRAGLLVLREAPDRPVPLTPEMVDWSRTRAWAEGGYYARVFFNMRGREPEGIVTAQERASLVAAVRDVLGTVPVGDGRVLHNSVCEPTDIYRRVRGLPPDLLVFFVESEGWRSMGSVGHGTTWATSNDTGLDEANHKRDGMYALCAAGVTPGRQRASILDITPSMLDILGLPADPALSGSSLVDAPRLARERLVEPAGPRR
jgi:predicted AlkP superfamily phosphohydrolase/phosphomutase